MSRIRLEVVKVARGRASPHTTEDANWVMYRLGKNYSIYASCFISKCTISSKEEGQIMLMLDGTFGCVHKRSSGKSAGPPKHKMRFFLDEEEVESFMREYDDRSKGVEASVSSPNTLFTVQNLLHIEMTRILKKTPLYKSS